MTMSVIHDTRYFVMDYVSIDYDLYAFVGGGSHIHHEYSQDWWRYMVCVSLVRI